MTHFPAYALITGASSGIGLEFAHQLAAQKTNLILVARSSDRLYQLSQELQTNYDIQVSIIVQDLTLSGAGTEVYKAVQTLGWPVHLLINNAGFGDYGLFMERDRLTQLAMIQLNITALVDLTHYFLPPMVQRRWGNVINVASIAAFQPIPFFSVYAATKAFVLSFSESLWAEVRPYGVKVIALCPGPTASNFMEIAQFPDHLSKNNPSLESAEQVVRTALAALQSDSANVVTGGWINQFIVNLSRFLPRELLVSIVGKQFQPPSSNGSSSH